LTRAAVVLLLVGGALAHEGTAQGAFKSEIVRLSRGASYVVHVRGTGVVSAYGGLDGIVSQDRPVQLVSSGTSAVLTAFGPVTRVTIRRSTTPGGEQLAAAPRCEHRRLPTVTGRSIHADLAVIGDGSAGFAAAIAAARRCLAVVFVSPDPLVGGMLVPGQIGIADGSPIVAWPEVNAQGGDLENGALQANSSWSLAGGVWGDFLMRVALVQNPKTPSLLAALRHLPSQAALAARALLRGLPNLRVITNTVPVTGAMSNGRVSYVETT
jgi:hypothetical protein